jgi:UDP-glucuronate decarboxylase
MNNHILEDDLSYINDKIGASKSKFLDSTILITGCAGFLGYYIMHFLANYAKQLGIRKIIGLDSFLLNTPKWITELADEKIVEIQKFDIISDNIEDVNGSKDANFVIHMASIASPTFYRKYPLVTIDANIWGLRKLLDYYCNKNLKGFLFFSSSEIYGDPSPDFIPTPEIYRGNVSTIGPRACYDESKRFGETLCEVFAHKYNMPIGIARPFNNFGPGMRLDDKRVPADFAKSIFENKDITIFSDGYATRTFCYVADAIVGYFKILLNGKFDIFNIGIESPEINVRQFAEIYKEQGAKYLDYTGEIKFSAPPEKEYLTHNPNRRCPIIEKAKKTLNYEPEVDVVAGVGKFLQFVKLKNGNL